MAKERTVILSTGIPGLDKTGYFREMKKVAKANNKDIKIYHVGDMLLKLAKENDPCFIKENVLNMPAKTLELISTGTLVCLESVLMSVDAGAVPEGEQVIATAGTECGLDTAWVIRASASHNVFHPSKGARFVELLAKPGIPTIPDVSIEYLR